MVLSARLFRCHDEVVTGQGTEIGVIFLAIQEDRLEEEIADLERRIDAERKELAEVAQVSLCLRARVFVPACAYGFVCVCARKQIFVRA